MEQGLSNSIFKGDKQNPFIKYAHSLQKEIALFASNRLLANPQQLQLVTARRHVRRVVLQEILTSTELIQLLFVPRQIKRLCFHTRMNILNKLTLKVQQNKRL